MKRLIQPMLSELYADHWMNDFLLEGESLDIAWQIHKDLQTFEPCGDDDNRNVWIEVPRGDISDWMSYEAALCYEDVHDEEDYVEAWEASYPREMEWLKVMTSVYNGNIFLRLFDGESCFGLYRSNDIGSCSKKKPSEYLGLLLNEIKLLKERIIDDPEAYNEYVENNLPKQKRTGRISRKELNRILPWYREEIENKEEAEKLLQDCIEYSGEPLDRMTIRIYCKYYRVAYEAYSGHQNFDAKDDVEFYTKCAFKHIDEELDVDSEKDFKKFAYDHYGELGLTRMNLYAFDYDVPGKWVFHFAVGYSAWLWDALKIAKALYESGAPLHISAAKRTLDALQERDYIRLTPHTFHNYLHHHDENSAMSLPYECECVDEPEPECFTCDQLQEVIAYSEWLPEDKLKIQHKIPLDSSIYDLIRDEVKEPMFLYDIKMYMWEKHDKYVSTSYCDEFEGNGYSYGHSDDKRIFDSWSEAIHAALVECIQKE